MGEATSELDFEFETEILLTLEGDFVNHTDKLEISDIDMLTSPTWLYFGEIEPDWFSD